MVHQLELSDTLTVEPVADATGPSGATSRGIDFVFVVILLVAAFLRYQIAANEPYIHDEDNTAIPLSKTISFTPGNLHLPVRGENHGALPAYVVKASSALFGTSPLAYRALHVLGGLATIVLIYVLTRQWYGPVAALWAAAFLAFNEYYLAISSRATAHVPHLLLVTSTIYAISRFLRLQRPLYLYLGALSLGLAFYCKEHSALLLPVFFVTLLHPRYRHWFRSPHPYLACALFVLLLGPDLYWNATTDRGTARIDYGTQVAGYANYRSHLQRIGGLGFSLYPSMFYARHTVMSAYLGATGRELRDETAEYRSMNTAIGVLLCGGVLLATFGAGPRHDMRRFLLILFWGVFGFFTFIGRGDPPGRLDPVSWIWVEATMLPAVILAGATLAGTTGNSRILAWGLGAAALIYACASVLNVG
jgi:4-amino-4-deoxy-L-arabinose transferase-like glycosyltransferase